MNKMKKILKKVKPFALKGLKYIKLNHLQLIQIGFSIAIMMQIQALREHVTWAFIQVGQGLGQVFQIVLVTAVKLFGGQGA